MLLLLGCLVHLCPWVQPLSRRSQSHGSITSSPVRSARGHDFAVENFLLLSSSSPHVRAGTGSRSPRQLAPVPNALAFCPILESAAGQLCAVNGDAAAGRDTPDSRRKLGSSNFEATTRGPAAYVCMMHHHLLLLMHGMEAPQLWFL